MLAGQQAAKQGLMTQAVSHLTQAGPYGWLPLTAAYLHADQLQPALLLLQQAVAQGYAGSSHAGLAHSSPGQQQAVDAGCASQLHADCAHDSAEARKGVECCAAQQLAQQWATLVQSIVAERNGASELMLLLFPAPECPQLGASQVLYLHACICLAGCRVHSDEAITHSVVYVSAVSVDCLVCMLMVVMSSQHIQLSQA